MWPLNDDRADVWWEGKDGPPPAHAIVGGKKTNWTPASKETGRAIRKRFATPWRKIRCSILMSKKEKRARSAAIIFRAA